MRFRDFFPIAIVCLAAGTALHATMASAAAQTDSAPLQLKKFMKAPIASSATHTVKKADGEYSHLGTNRLQKRKTATRRNHPAEAAPENPRLAASDEQALVRIVAADEINEIDLAADEGPIIPVAVLTSTETVQVASPDELNAIDQAAATLATSSSESTPLTTPSEHRSLLLRMLDGINVVITATTTAVKALFA